MYRENVCDMKCVFSRLQKVQIKKNFLFTIDTELERYSVHGDFVLNSKRSYALKIKFCPIDLLPTQKPHA